MHHVFWREAEDRRPPLPKTLIGLLSIRARGAACVRIPPSVSLLVHNTVGFRALRDCALASAMR
jgi:hypothetical protein